MALSSPAKAGIIIVVLSTLLLAFITLYYFYRHRTHDGSSKATTPSSPTGSQSPTLSPPQIRGNKRRAGDQNVQPQQQPKMYPCLKNGPGPMLRAVPEPDTPPYSTIRAVPATSASTFTSAMRLITGESDKRSSLHQAVLDVGTSHGNNNSSTPKEASENTKAKDADDNHVARASTGRQKTYTGAWP
jgi:hypothetical protein